MARKPLVALVGRPNVGKSTLFNRLVGQRHAVTDDRPGTTRDRIQGQSDWNGIDFYVVDTGGIEVYQPTGVGEVLPLAEDSANFIEEMKAQSLAAIREADVIVLMVDTSNGLTGADEEIADILRRTNVDDKPIFIAANKSDNLGRNNDAYEFYALGLGQVFPISAIHGLGVGDLLDSVVEVFQNLPVDESEPDDENTMKVAIVGRPNVGKSSMLNHLLGEERVIVSPIAGTTRDSIDTNIMWHDTPVMLIDTAGIRKRGKIESGVEKYSVLRAIRSIERADVALLMLDAETGLTEQDEHIAGFIMEANKSVVIVVNKWDAIEKDEHTMVEFTKKVEERFHFLPYAPIIFVSAKTGQRIHQVLETAHRIWEGRYFRIPTSELNRILRAAQQKHPAPTKGVKRLKIFFATQVAVDPPVFLFHVNDTRLVHFSYKRFLENQIRAEFPFEGTPVILSFRPREGMDDAN
ncbi:MAG: ribosome biogenesis GTPase Der [Burkholderiales bacterium]|nr:ribosome biogenesis GTPase Der [Anaerolineae bacterium]